MLRETPGYIEIVILPSDDLPDPTDVPNYNRALDEAERVTIPTNELDFTRSIFDPSRQMGPEFLNEAEFEAQDISPVLSGTIEVYEYPENVFNHTVVEIDGKPIPKLKGEGVAQYMFDESEFRPQFGEEPDPE